MGRLVTFDADDLITEWACVLLREDDANPDVGMGMLPKTAVEKALEHYDMSLDDIDYFAVLTRVMSKMRGTRGYP